MQGTKEITNAILFTYAALEQQQKKPQHLRPRIDFCAVNLNFTIAGVGVHVICLSENHLKELMLIDYTNDSLNFGEEGA